jgi:hypothetical protein
MKDIYHKIDVLLEAFTISQVITWLNHMVEADEEEKHHLVNYAVKKYVEINNL